MGRDGLATIPLTAPPKLRAMIVAGNQVARKPYVYGGGHGGGPEGVFTDSAYDCSGSISYALASAGFIKSPMASSGLAKFGKPGPESGARSTPTADTRSWSSPGFASTRPGGRSATPVADGGAQPGALAVRHPPGL